MENAECVCPRLAVSHRARHVIPSQNRGDKMRAALLPLVVCELAAGFYLPGVAPIDYADGARVDLKVPRHAPGSPRQRCQMPTLAALDRR